MASFPSGILLLATMCSLLLSCRATRDEKNGEEKSEAVPQLFSKPIPPNTCRIVGTIVAIDSALEQANPSDPCAKVPCRATIRVDSILGYGQAFGGALARGEHISVKFAFTLGRTQDHFTDMTESYPGLHLGSRFQADVQGVIDSPGMKETARVHLIYGYRLLK